MSTYTFHYGAYAHPSCEVYPRRITMAPIRSRDNTKWATHIQMEIAGDLVGANTPAEVVARIAGLDAAYASDFSDAGFKLDGSWTPHVILTNDVLNITGNRITYRSWDNQLPTELANTRSFSVGIEAIYALADNGIVEYRETTTKTGTGGADFKLYALANGVPVKQSMREKTIVRHVTTGRYVSLQPWIGPPAPYWPLEEKVSQRIIRYSSPIVHGHPSGKFTHYAVDYTYFFERLGPDATTPFNTWFAP